MSLDRPGQPRPACPIGGGIGHHLAGATAGGTLTITTGTGFTLSPGGVIAVQATTATVSIREAILATSQATAMAGAAGLSNLIHMTATGGPDPAREMAEKEAASVAPNTHGPDVRTLNPVPNPARPVYKQGHAGQPVIDHIRPRAAGGHPNDPSNLHVKPWKWNARKGAYEGQLLKAHQYYIRQGLTPE